MGEFIIGSAAREQFSALLTQIDDAHARMRALSCDEVGTEFRVEMAERLESQERSNRGLMYRVFGQIADPPDVPMMMATAVDQLWARLRIPPNEIKRRMKVAARLCPRRQISGPPLPAELEQVATAVSDGVIGEDHLKAITRAMDKLPSCVSAAERDEVETSLVREAIKSDAEIVTTAAKMIDAIFNPDGDYDEKDRERRRGVTLGPQGRDGMSRLNGWIDPETRCYVEAATAAVRPGRHLPDGTTAEVKDERSIAQRCHDGVASSRVVYESDLITGTGVS